jgi:hypothetical protein
MAGEGLVIHDLLICPWRLGRELPTKALAWYEPRPLASARISVSLEIVKLVTKYA